MKILIACEFSGVVRDAFRAKGHDAYSCDLLPSNDPTYHLQQDVVPIHSLQDFAEEVEVNPEKWKHLDSNKDYDQNNLL